MLRLGAEGAHGVPYLMQKNGMRGKHAKKTRKTELSWIWEISHEMEGNQIELDRMKRLSLKTFTLTPREAESYTTHPKQS